MQEQHIIGINHGGVGHFAMRLPNWPAVKVFERLRARRHVSKTSQPDKSVWIIEIAELTDDLYSERFLRFDKFPVEQIDNTSRFPGCNVYRRSSTIGQQFCGGCASGFSIPKSCAANGTVAIRKLNARKIGFLS
jgi:hypothetical protein